MQCATHPSVETELACGRCGKPICPRCLVQTPVGARCRECARVRRIPTYNISLAYLLRGLSAALVAGVAAGLVWGYLLPNLGLLIGIFGGIGLGYLVAESTALATNRKSGPPLQAVAVLGVVIAFILRSVIAYHTPFPTNDALGYILAGLAAFSAIGRLR